MFETKCKNCQKAVEKQKTFCSRSCSAKYNNKLRTKKEKPCCINCKKELNNRVKQYCDNKCQAEYRYIQKTLPEFNEGKIEHRNTLRRILNLERGSKCSICNIEQWEGKALVLEVDHVDGNALNNKPDNLRLICPNCHSQTATYKGANRGNGRKARLVKSV